MTALGPSCRRDLSGKCRRNGPGKGVARYGFAMRSRCNLGEALTFRGVFSRGRMLCDVPWILMGSIVKLSRASAPLRSLPQIGVGGCVWGCAVTPVMWSREGLLSGVVEDDDVVEREGVRVLVWHCACGGELGHGCRDRAGFL